MGKTWQQKAKIQDWHKQKIENLEKEFNYLQAEKDKLDRKQKEINSKIMYWRREAENYFPCGHKSEYMINSQNGDANCFGKEENYPLKDTGICQNCLYNEGFPFTKAMAKDK